MPMNHKNYPPEWKQISLRIREREGWVCKFCGIANQAINPKTGKRVILTVAHLNHMPMDCRDENLAALCNSCHLRYDAELHYKHAQKTRRLKRHNPDQPMLLMPTDS